MRSFNSGISHNALRLLSRLVLASKGLETQREKSRNGKGHREAVDCLAWPEETLFFSTSFREDTIDQSYLSIGLRYYVTESKHRNIMD